MGRPGLASSPAVPLALPSPVRGLRPRAAGEWPQPLWASGQTRTRHCSKEEEGPSLSLSLSMAFGCGFSHPQGKPQAHHEE